jgi:DNA polymerase II small subunit
VPLEEPVSVARALASRGYNADREAVTLLANAPAPAAAIDHAVEAAPDGTTRLTAAEVRPAVEATAGAADRTGGPHTSNPTAATADGDATASGGTDVHDSDDGAAPDSTVSGGTDVSDPDDGSSHDPSVSTGDNPDGSSEPLPGTAAEGGVPVETEGSGRTADRPDTAVTDPGTGTDAAASSPASTPSTDPTSTDGSASGTAVGDRDPSERSVEVSGDVTGRSTGTGRYRDFVSVFRDRYERLSGHLKGRVNHRSTDALANAGGGGEAGLVGMVAEINSTKSGHWMIDLEDTRGTFPCLVMKDKEIAGHVEELLLDEVIAVEGSVSGDGSILFVDDLHFPDVPRTHRPSTADRHVRAALISDVHVGSQEFLADEWSAFADWLHTEDAERVEYLCIAGDMVEGVGVYPDQDEELDVVDIYDQYERFSEHLKEVPGDMEIVMIPGNHDAVRLAEPQPGFDEELRDIMSAHDARIVGNPSTVTLEGVDILLYHGVSLDEVIAELPEEKASYEEPHLPMYQLLKKRHVAPQFGGHTRLAPEEQDYLVMDDVPDIFHTGHVHKFGYGKYRNVLAVNTGCWQAQTAFQKSVNIDPDTAYAPVVDLDRLDEPDPMAIYDFN